MPTDQLNPALAPRPLIGLGGDTPCLPSPALLVAITASRHVQAGSAASGATPATPLLGTAGWSIASALGAQFPGQGSHLERYAQVLGAVEINSSFYRPHRPATYARWAAAVPPGFRFSVKLPRSITHDARLRDTAPLLAQFAAEAGALGTALGCILVQLPPSLIFEAVLVDGFLQQLAALFPCAIACEARHPSWFAPDATALMQAHGVMRVMADPAPGQLGGYVPTSPGLYLRLHGSPQRYYSTYTPSYLAALAREMNAHLDANLLLWCIFDNTAGGAALPNALTLLGELAC